MYADMELWAEIRRRVLTGELSKREACRQYDLHWLTLKKILSHEEPPGYRRTKPPRRSKIDPVLPIIGLWRGVLALRGGRVAGGVVGVVLCADGCLASLVASGLLHR